MDIAPGNNAGQIFVPSGYVSGSVLSDTSTWNGTTIAGLGLTPGTYTYDWGTGPTADSFTLQIGPLATVPEPASFYLLALIAIGFVVMFSRLRKSQT